MPGAGFGLRGMSRSRRGRGEVLPGRGAWRGTAEWVRDPRRGPETKRELPVCAAAPQRDPQGSLWPPLHRALRPQPWSQWPRPGEATLAGGLSFCAPENLILGPDLVPADPSPHRLSLARTWSLTFRRGCHGPGAVCTCRRGEGPERGVSVRLSGAEDPRGLGPGRAHGDIVAEGHLVPRREESLARGWGQARRSTRLEWRGDGDERVVMWLGHRRGPSVLPGAVLASPAGRCSHVGSAKL